MIAARSDVRELSSRPVWGDGDSGASPPSLDDGAVHLWRMSLEAPPVPVDVLYSYISPDEIERAQRYVFSHDRDQFVIARGCLRLILAGYVGCAPGEVVFGYGAHGKPYLGGHGSGEDIRFNVSHSGELGLCAVSRGRDVGVDVEWIRPDVDILGIARTTFSPAERERIEALPEALRVAGFFNCWTRKEAYIKARGEGLRYPLDAFDVSLVPGEPAALLCSAEGLSEQRRWMFQNLDVGPGYAAALVVERPARERPTS